LTTRTPALPHLWEHENTTWTRCNHSLISLFLYNRSAQALSTHDRWSRACDMQTPYGCTCTPSDTGGESMAERRKRGQYQSEGAASAQSSTVSMIHLSARKM